MPFTSFNLQNLYNLRTKYSRFLCLVRLLLIHRSEPVRVCSIGVERMRTTTIKT